MKKILCLVALCLGMIACGQKEEKKAEAAKPAEQSQIVDKKTEAPKVEEKAAEQAEPVVVEEQVEEVVAVPEDNNTQAAAPAQTTTETK